MVTNCMLLSVLFVSGAWAVCVKNLYITAPKNMVAISGSCLQIPCNFSAEPETDFNSSLSASGVWIKNDSKFRNNPKNVIFNSSGTVTTYPMNITGNLNRKECTTLFSSLVISYTDTYFFRIENSAFKATAACEPLQITVQDVPPRPKIEISGDLKENKSVNITCSASTPCPHSPPKLTWTLTQDPHNTTEENKDRTLTTKIKTTIILSDQHDGVNFSCSASYPVEGGNYKTAEEELTLSVSYAPKNTSVIVSPPGLVSAGSCVNLTCSSRAKPPVRNFTWFKISENGPIRVSEGDFYSVNVTEAGVYYCVASNELGDQNSSEIHLTIEGVNQPDSSSSPWGAVVGAVIGVIILICVVVVIWCLKSKHSPSRQTQSQTAEQSAFQESGKATETEDIHYGEIDFSKRRPEASSSSVQDSGQQQDTLYAQVNVPETANSLTQTADVPQDLYAQVKY
ncbi:vascular cell adhesion protein 1-like [Plectropomus leopardus]|uniref:vascular cell adhesion protein 1-like n=1 Tax=Plectropomus leopardus TaxID=160734 RepID=UPI001C4DBDBF|nr:vascular cell adhesion protein 1-like [Plectropomus leopardus]